MHKDKNLLVTIWCITYNHENFIRKCLDGFVMQKTNFRYEAIVHDDASKDGTANIIREYADKYPDIIKPIIEKENQYSKKDGSLDRIMINACKGKYIALCEGDDYWIDPLKLQKQVDILEKFPQCSMTVSSNYVYNEVDHLFFKANPIPITESRFLTMREVLREEGGLIPTASMCFRRECLLLKPSTFSTPFVGDRPLRMWCAVNGLIYYDITRMTVYRIGVSGSFGQKARVNYEFAKNNLKYMNMFYDRFDEYTNFQYHNDVEYLKHREEYFYLLNIKSVNRFFCNFFKNMSFRSKTMIVIKHLVTLVFPLLFNKLKIFSSSYTRTLPNIE